METLLNDNTEMVLRVYSDGKKMYLEKIKGVYVKEQVECIKRISYDSRSHR